MQRLNKKRVTQIEALKLVDEKLNEEFSALVSSDSTHVKVVNFNLWFSIEMGSVKGSVYFEDVAKLMQPLSRASEKTAKL